MLKMTVCFAAFPNINHHYGICPIIGLHWASRNESCTCVLSSGKGVIIGYNFLIFLTIDPSK